MWLAISPGQFQPLILVSKVINFSLYAGSIPLRELVYRVQPLPPSIRPLVWDFGTLTPDVERVYIEQIIQDYVSFK